MPAEPGACFCDVECIIEGLLSLLYKICISVAIIRPFYMHLRVFPLPYSSRHARPVIYIQRYVLSKYRGGEHWWRLERARTLVGGENAGDVLNLKDSSLLLRPCSLCKFFFFFLNPMNSTTFILFDKYCPIMNQLGSKDYLMIFN